MSKNILSLFDYSGIWPSFFKDYGYHIYTHDIKSPLSEFLYPERIHILGDILEWKYPKNMEFDVILCGPPCTHYSLSGSRFFKQKDLDGRTEESNKLVYKALEIIDYYKPRVWALENPMSRIHKCVPELGNPIFKFHPWHFGALVNPIETYWKSTWLWGKFTIPKKYPVLNPDIRDSTGNTSLNNRFGGKSEKTKIYRSITPRGFAKSFAESNYK